MKHGIYIGTNPDLRGEAALIKDDPESKTRGCLVQFDNMDKLPTSLTHGWSSFYWYEFDLDKEVQTNDDTK